MNPIPYDAAALQPLTSDELIVERVTDLVGRAQSTQLWLMFLDDDGMQLPLLLPISDANVAVAASDVRWAPLLRNVTQTVDAASLIVVIERFGPEALTRADRFWVRTMVDACEEAGISISACVLSHRRGVRLITPDELP